PRSRDCDRMLRRVAAPMYLQRNKAVDLDAAAGTEIPGVFRGIGRSSGHVTGTARIVKGLGEIGRVNKGDILIANATDPGWTSVFLIIKGVVVETGGMLSHASCID